VAAPDFRGAFDSIFDAHRTYIIRKNFHAFVNSPLTPLAPCTASSTHTFIILAEQRSSSRTEADTQSMRRTRRTLRLRIRFDPVKCHDSLAPRRAELCCVPDVSANEHAFYLR